MLAARERRVLLEVNDASLTPGSFRVNSRENCARMLKLCMEYQVPVLLSSDAHFFTAVGRHQHAHALLGELGFPEELAVNRSAEAFTSFIGA